MPELPEMEIAARRLDASLKDQRIKSTLVPGINVLRTFNPSIDALNGSVIRGVARRGKLLELQVESVSEGSLTLLMHLMSAGRLQLVEKLTSPRDRAARILIRLESGQELRMREFGSKQAAWVKLLKADTVHADDAVSHLGPEAWPNPPRLDDRITEPRPLHSLLRDQRVIAGIGRTWVDEILHSARLSPFKRGNDLTLEEGQALKDAMIAELGRAIEFYEESIALPLPEKFPKPTRIHSHQSEPCYRCGTILEAVFYESYVMSYCPSCQTDGRVLKDRRLSRLLK